MLHSSLGSSVTEKKINELMRVYSSLEKKEKKFTSSFSLECVSSCGECCRHYIPYLSSSEALLAAYYIIKEGREDEIRAMLEKGDEKKGICPLYNPEKSKHCSFYEGRSMVCRLFGASVSLSKMGRMEFKDCKWKKEKRTISSEELEKKQSIVPVMSIYGSVLEEDGESIYTALPQAIDKIKLLLSYSGAFPA